MRLCSLIIIDHVSVIALLFHVFRPAATLLHRRMNNASRLIASRLRRSRQPILPRPPIFPVFPISRKPEERDCLSRTEYLSRLRVRANERERKETRDNCERENRGNLSGPKSITGARYFSRGIILRINGTGRIVCKVVYPGNGIVKTRVGVETQRAGNIGARGYAAKTINRSGGTGTPIKG